MGGAEVELTWLLSGIALWFAAGSALSAYARRRTGSGVVEYFLAGRGIGGLVSALTYSATTYSAFMMVGLVGLTYKSGAAAIGFELTYLLGTVVLLSVFGPRFWAAGRRFDLVSPGELLSLRYGDKRVGAAAAALCLVMLLPYAAVQLMGIGYLLNTLSGGGLPFAVGVLLAAGIAFAYSWWAGMRSVAWTDALQSGIMLVASVLLVLFLQTRMLPGGLGGALTARPELLRATWSFPLFLGLALPWAFFAVTNPQVVQRLYIPKDPASLRRMVLLFAVFGLAYTLLCGYLGLAAGVALPGLANPDGAMPELLARVPGPLALVVALSIMAAAVSTLNSIVLTLSSQVGRDLARALSPSMGDARELAWGKGAIPVITLACIAFALARPGLIAVLSAMASGGLLVQLPAVTGAFFWRRGTRAGALASLLGGAAVVGALSAAGWKPLGHWPGIWGLAVATGLYVGVSLLTRPDPGAAAFHDGVEEDLKVHFGL